MMQPTKKPNQDSSRPNILIAEDNEDNRYMMRTMLEMKGYRVVEARDGEEAIEQAVSQEPDLVLLDQELPGLDGIKVTTRLRLMDKTRDLPIVMISGWDPAHHQGSALAAGCNEYLPKPIDLEQLEKMLSRYAPLPSDSKADEAQSR